VVGVVLGAWYMLQAMQRVFFGPSREPPRSDHGKHGQHAQHGHGDGANLDLRWHELAALAPLAVFVVWIGLVPGTFLAPVSQAVRAASDNAAFAFAARMADPPAAGNVALPSASPEPRTAAR